MSDQEKILRDQNSLLAEQIERLVRAAIVTDWQEDFRGEAGGSGSYRKTYVWRLGGHSGHEPTCELTRAAVLRIANMEE